MCLFCRQRVRSCLYGWKKPPCHKVLSEFGINSRFSFDLWWIRFMYWMFSAALFSSIWYVKFHRYQKSILICWNWGKEKQVMLNTLPWSMIKSNKLAVIETVMFLSVGYYWLYFGKLHRPYPIANLILVVLETNVFKTWSKNKARSKTVHL